MCSIYGILFGTLFVIFSKDSYLDQAIACPDDPKALYNAGTELYLNGDYSKAVSFLENAKKNCVQSSKQHEKYDNHLFEDISLNLAHSLVKAEKYQEALAEYKDLYSKFKNSKAAKNIPILEKFLQQQEQQDKQQNNDQNQNEDQSQNENQDQEAKDEQNDLNSKPNSKSDQAKQDFDQKKEQKNNEKFDNKQDQKEEKLKQEQQEDKQREKTKDSKKNPAHQDNSINSKHQNYDKQKMHNQQMLDKDEKTLLQAIENFDQDMMKMYAAANCGGTEDNGW